MGAGVTVLLLPSSECKKTINVINACFVHRPCMVLHRRATFSLLFRIPSLIDNSGAVYMEGGRS